jgi:Meckel syndrome type 1 protein
MLGLFAAGTSFALTANARGPSTTEMPPVDPTPTTVLEPDVLSSADGPAVVRQVPAPKLAAPAAAPSPAVTPPATAAQPEVVVNTTPAQPAPASPAVTPPATAAQPEVVANTTPAQPAPASPAEVNPASARPEPPAVALPDGFLSPVRVRVQTAPHTPQPANTPALDSASASTEGNVQRPETPAGGRFRVPVLRRKPASEPSQPKRVPAVARTTDRDSVPRYRVPVLIGTRR